MLSFLSRFGLTFEYKHLFALLLYIWAYGLPRLHIRRRWGKVSEYRHLEPADSVTSQDDDPLQQLYAQVPQATLSECQRFYKARAGKIPLAVNMLRKYIQWHKQHTSLPTTITGNKNTQQRWEESVRRALSICNEEIKGTINTLPQVATLPKALDVEGKRIVHIVPGKIDERLASLKVYSYAIAIYIDLLLDRNSEEKITVAIDVRGGVGWRSLHATKLVPFIQHTSTLLLAMFPERLHRAIVYPIPPTFAWVWRIVQRCIDPLTRDKICLLEGPATIDSPPPKQFMERYLGTEVVEMLEGDRIASFIQVG